MSTVESRCDLWETYVNITSGFHRKLQELSENFDPVLPIFIKARFLIYSYDYRKNRKLGTRSVLTDDLLITSNDFLFCIIIISLDA